MSQLKYLFSFLFMILVIGDGNYVNGKKERVRLTDIQTLTLYADKRTTSRRSSPIKQLTCVGGSCSRVDVRTVQCYNRGSDGTDVQWECKADMPSNYKFGKLEVSCEGYDYPEDDYILAGSCGLEYTIDQVAGSSDYHQQYSSKYFENNYKSEFSYFPIFVILGIMFLIYYTCLRDTSRTERNSGTGDDSYRGDDHGGGGGSGWFSGSSPRPSAPPPPPGFRPDLFGDSCSGTRQRTSQSGSSSGPGFFSGMAAGGLMGYLFGSSGSNTYSRRRSPYASTSFFDSPSTSSGYSSFSRPSSSSSSTSTSTGFASTKRR